MQVLGGILFIPKLHPSLLEGIGPNAIIFTLQIEFTQNGIDILLRKLLFDFLYNRYDPRMGKPGYDNGDIICLIPVPVPAYTDLYKTRYLSCHKILSSLLFWVRLKLIQSFSNFS